MFVKKKGVSNEPTVLLYALSFAIDSTDRENELLMLLATILTHDFLTRYQDAQPDEHKTCTNLLCVYSQKTNHYIGLKFT